MKQFVIFFYTKKDNQTVRGGWSYVTIMARCKRRAIWLFQYLYKTEYQYIPEVFESEAKGFKMEYKVIENTKNRDFIEGVLLPAEITRSYRQGKPCSVVNLLKKGLL